MSYHSRNLIDLRPEPALLLDFLLFLHGAHLPQHPLLLFLPLDTFLVEALAIVDEVPRGSRDRRGRVVLRGGRARRAGGRGGLREGGCTRERKGLLCLVAGRIGNEIDAVGLWRRRDVVIDMLSLLGDCLLMKSLLD